jgi:hypothetical protein
MALYSEYVFSYVSLVKDFKYEWKSQYKQTVNISISVDYIQGKIFSNIIRRELNVTPM